MPADLDKLSAIWSASMIVESLCAMTIVVLPFIKTSSAFWTKASDTESRDDVASSRIKIGGFFSIALAMAILCLCPPDNLSPRSPITVLYFSGNCWMNSSAYAFLAAWMISSSEASGLPKAIFCLTVSLNRIIS